MGQIFFIGFRGKILFYPFLLESFQWKETLIANQWFVIKQKFFLHHLVTYWKQQFNQCSFSQEFIKTKYNFLASECPKSLVDQFVTEANQISSWENVTLEVKKILDDLKLEQSEFFRQKSIVNNKSTGRSQGFSNVCSSIFEFAIQHPALTITISGALLGLFTAYFYQDEGIMNTIGSNFDKIKSVLPNLITKSDAKKDSQSNLKIAKEILDQHQRTEASIKVHWWFRLKDRISFFHQKNTTEAQAELLAKRLNKHELSFAYLSQIIEILLKMGNINISNTPDISPNLKEMSLKCNNENVPISEEDLVDLNIYRKLFWLVIKPFEVFRDRSKSRNKNNYEPPVEEVKDEF